VKQKDHPPFKLVVIWDNEPVSWVVPYVAILVQGVFFCDGFEVLVVVVLGSHHGWDGGIDGRGINEHGIGERGFPFRFWFVGVVRSSR
jgi:hypothetical protein